MPLVPRDGEPTGYVGIVVDSTDEGAAARILHPSERLVETLVDQSPEIMTVLNADGTWRYSNAAASRLLGYRSGFDPADGILSLVHPDDVATVVAMIRELQAGGSPGPDPVETRVRAGDGTWRYLESVVEDLVDDPVVHGYLIRSRDVTETRQTRLDLLEANERLSALIRSLHLAVLLESADRTIVLTNEAFSGLFELSVAPEQLIGHRLADFTPELSRRFGDPTSDDPRVQRTSRILRAQRTKIGDRIELNDGRTLERDYIPIVVDGSYRGHVWLFRDVSAQAQTEAEWSALIETQRRENSRLVELDRMKAAFLAEISHELRTPLTSILSFAELLTDGLGKDDPAEQAEFVEIIRRNADRLLRLVDDLLLLDRMESGAMPLEWGVVDLPSLVSSSVNAFSPAAEAKTISLEVELGDGPSVPGDPGRLAQVLDVLLSNALKFTPEKGRILVRAVPADDLWRLEVTDTGIGVPMRERGEIFERFFRATNARISRIPGSGLGLAVARTICEMHGGSISLRSREGAGTTVTVTIPFERAGDGVTFEAGTTKTALPDGGARVGESAP